MSASINFTQCRTVNKLHFQGDRYVNIIDSLICRFTRIWGLRINVISSEISNTTQRKRFEIFHLFMLKSNLWNSCIQKNNIETFSDFTKYCQFGRMKFINKICEWKDVIKETAKVFKLQQVAAPSKITELAGNSIWKIGPLQLATWTNICFTSGICTRFELSLLWLVFRVLGSRRMRKALTLLT